MGDPHIYSDEGGNFKPISTFVPDLFAVNWHTLLPDYAHLSECRSEFPACNKDTAIGCIPAKDVLQVLGVAIQ